jgi:copper transport protein
MQLESRLRRGALAAAVASIVVLVATDGASGHSASRAHLELSRSTPSEGAHLAAAPRTLKLTFTEPVELSIARLRLIGPSDAVVPITPLRQPDDSVQILIADVIGPLVGGVYRLEWQVAGTDGHPVRGTISYVVAPGATGLDDPARPGAATRGDRGAPAPDPGAEASSHDPTSMPSGEFFDAESTGYVVVRALQFIALLTVIGALTFGFVVLGMLRRTETDPAVVASMRTRAAAVGLWAAVALLVTAILRLYAQSLAMHGPDEALAPAYIAAMVAKTVWGWGWLLQATGAVLAITGFAMARRERSSGWLLSGVAGATLSLTPALSGHAAATPGLATLAVIADALHVIGAAGWLGSLCFVLVVGIPVALRLDGDRRGAAIARLVGAFSPTALMFAGLAALTGVFAAWLRIGFTTALWTSDYGRVLLIKLAILAVVAAIGVYNWRRVKPALGDDAGTRRMQRSATTELGVGVLVVIVTAVLVATPPPTADMGAEARLDNRAPATRD